jgi:D-apiose dehydrogenase
MVEGCRNAGVPLAIHENWRWQTAIRQVKAALDTRAIGAIHRARIDYANSFPVFENQPFLKELEQFILTDIGSHILDVARFLFGEARTLYCQTQRVHRDIKGEDVATVMMRMHSDATVTCNMSYASPVEHDRFP